MRRLIFSLLFLGFILISLSGQAYWFEFSEAKRLHAAGDLGDSLQILLKLRTEFGTEPEISFYMGKIYWAQNQFALASDYIFEAWDTAEISADSDLWYEISLYILSTFRFRREFEDDWILVAKELIRRTEDLIQLPEIDWSDQLVRLGSDRFFELYRFSNPLAEKAYRYLGLHYFENEDYEQAEENLLKLILSYTSTLGSYLLDRDPAYRYYNLRLLYLDLSLIRELDTYIVQEPIQESAIILSLMYKRSDQQGQAADW
jgi:hypothetical protein